VEGFGIAAGGVSAVHPPFDWMRTVSGQETTHRSCDFSGTFPQ
jgi:hypothetical protein